LLANILFRVFYLSVVLCGYGTRFLTLREKHGLRVSENRVLRKIFGPKGEEVEGGWRRPYNEVLHNLFASPNIIRVIKSRRMRWAGHVTSVGKMRNACNILVTKHEGKRPLGRNRRRWQEDIRMNLREIVWGRVDWMHLV